MKQPVIAIIGAGSVGATAAYSLVMRNVAAKILLVDVNTAKCQAEVRDITDSCALSTTSSISFGSLQDAAQADIIVITAGAPQKPGQPRLELIHTNYEIVGSIIQGMKPIKSSSIIIVVTNPVDILTRYVQEIAQLPKNQVFGSGTLLDTRRLCGFLGEYLQIHPNSIDAYVLGEHGDSQFVAWSLARIGGVPLSSFEIPQQELDAMAVKAQRRVYEVIAGKQAVAFAIASCITTYCENILSNSQKVLPVSCFIQDLGLCLSMPVVLGLQGIEHILRPPLTAHEQEQLTASAKVLDTMYKK